MHQQLPDCYSTSLRLSVGCQLLPCSCYVEYHMKYHMFLRNSDKVCGFLNFLCVGQNDCI